MVIDGLEVGWYILWLIHMDTEGAYSLFTVSYQPVQSLREQLGGRDRYKYELLLHLDRKITKTEMKGNLLNRQSSHYLKEEAGDWVAWVASTCLGSPPIQAAFH